ncbi:MAG: DUF4124 domain-containing protein [Gammaproteobacteria bacterium]|nr:DUF4124 domain-containing protein [Gammaproteobacteria bacterium]
MKSTIISMFIVLIVMVTLPMFLFGDGDLAQKFGFGNGGADADNELFGKTPKNVRAVVTDKKVEVYKWVDEYGVTQFSNLPPQEGGGSEKIVLSPNTNIMDAVKIPEKEQEEEVKSQVFSLGSPYSPGGMKKMVDDSMAMQEQLNQRQADQDKMIQDMFKQK